MLCIFIYELQLWFCLSKISQHWTSFGEKGMKRQGRHISKDFAGLCILNLTVNHQAVNSKIGYESKKEF